MGNFQDTSKCRTAVCWTQNLNHPRFDQSTSAPRLISHNSRLHCLYYDVHSDAEDNAYFALPSADNCQPLLCNAQPSSLPPCATEYTTHGIDESADHDALLSSRDMAFVDVFTWQFEQLLDSLHFPYSNQASWSPLHISAVSLVLRHLCYSCRVPCHVNTTCLLDSMMNPFCLLAG